jgi:riboflavin transporter
MAEPIKTAGKKRSVWSVRELVTLAIFSALGMALSFIQIPIFPPAPYLQYDPSGIVTLTVALMYGPLAGIVVQLVSWIPKLIMSPLGSLLTFVAMIGAVLVVGLIYKRLHNLKGAIVSLVAGSIVFIILAIAMNFLITPIYSPGVTVEAVAGMVVPILLPFNLIKCGINGVATGLLYKPVSNLVKMRDSRSHL